jgi:hypothetical protein
VVLVGVKVTLSDWVPGGGAVVGVVNVNIPATGVLPTMADPPLRVEDAKVWPKVITLAVGNVNVGVALFTSTLTALTTGK